MSLTVRVNSEICQGNGVCTHRAPDVFELGDDELAVVKVNALPDEQLEFIERAAASCPTQAIEIEKS